MEQFSRLDAEDLDLVLKTLKEFVDREAPLSKRLAWDDEDVCPEAVVRAMSGPEVGLHLVFLSSEFDGMGGGAYDVYRLSCEFAKVDLGLATAMLAVALGTDPIRVGCTHEQQAKWITRIANEGLIVAYGVTEPEAGSNVSSLKTVAERVTDEAGRVTHYKLNGVKQFISNGSIADLYTILAKAPDGPTFFVVERNTPGLTPGKHEIKHGIRLSDTAQVVLQDVVIPAFNIVGDKEGEGLKQANEVFGYTRLMVAAFGLGAGVAALDKAIAFSKERKQFGSLPLREAGLHAQAARAEQRPPGGGQGLHRVRRRPARLGHAGPAGGRLGRQAVRDRGRQHRGRRRRAGAGRVRVLRRLRGREIRRDARILRIYEGTSEIQQNIIAIFRLRENVRTKGKFYERPGRRSRGMDRGGRPAHRPGGADGVGSDAAWSSGTS